MPPPWVRDDRWLPDDERLIVTYTDATQLVAWFSLDVIRQTDEFVGEDIGPVIRVAYFTVERHERGKYPTLVKHMICDMIRQAKLADEFTIRAIVIDPLHDAHGIQRALSKRPEATRLRNYPWPYVIRVSSLAGLEVRYCSDGDNGAFP